MQQPVRTLACLILATSLFGCASTSSDESKQATSTNIQLDLYDTLKVKLDDATSRHSDEQLKWYATQAYSSMTKALKEARSAYSEFEHEPSKINDSDLFSSQNYGQEMTASLDAFELAYRSAIATKQRVLSVMSVSFENNTYLEKVNAQTLFPTEFKRVEQQFKRTIDYIANNETIDNERLIALETKQHQLEAKSVTKHYLGEAKQQFSQHKKQRYSVDAPLVMARSEATLSKAEAFIQSSPRNHDEIQVRADTVSFALQRTEKIVQQVRELKSLPEKQYERYILNLEAQLHAIAVASATGDHRNKTLIEHAKYIESSMLDTQKSDDEKWLSLTMELKQVKQDIEATAAQSNQLMAEKQALQSKVNSLEAQKVAQLNTGVTQPEPESLQVENIAPVTPAAVTPAVNAAPGTDALDSEVPEAISESSPVSS
ncbi:synaptonemal complex protein 1 [Vibrio methylphosphonaticus]|uniref:hypothetical protein n=1 Tax=Vibrio methylphosphonaticus TaxID=2946866 RepID=UPI00202A4417|nr:hypothetical protein [Vibrio methylphosphonaticus]MCL9776864.1 hypothetical protein [Vibrio methylphosphonaticus]